MPTYTFKVIETGEVQEHKMSYTVLDQFKLDNPHLEQHIFLENFPVYSDGARLSVPGMGKPDSSFEKYVIGRIKDGVGQNTVKNGHKHKQNREW
jgi:hypothetical protein